MKNLTLFYLPGCPHCRLALRLLDELTREDARYRAVSVELVDESREKARASAMNYWYVPCFFAGEEKLHEGHAEKEDVRRVLERALSDAPAEA